MLYLSHTWDMVVKFGDKPETNIDVVKFQKKAVRLFKFKDKYKLTKPLFNELRILYFDGIVNLHNCLLVLNVLNNEVPKALQEFFKNITNQSYYNTRVAYHNKLNLPQVRTTYYELQSIKYKSCKAWNEIQTEIRDKFNIGYWSKNSLSKSL